MQTTKKLIIILFPLFFLNTCIEKYFLEEDVEFVPVVVVDALINNLQEEQEIIISTSTTLQFPKFNPLSDCFVQVIDKNDNIFQFTESVSDRGHYNGIIGSEYLIPGNEFKIYFSTNKGREYESSFETMLISPPVDSVYYELMEENYVGDNNYPETGIQFYINIKADNTYGNYYRRQLTETYEYSATWPIKKYWDNGKWVTVPAHRDYFTCYKTLPIQKIFSTSVNQLNENANLKYPLHFVNNETQRLFFRYSLLVKQMAITEEAFFFWNLMEANNQDAGGLFDGQPADITGNIVCITDPEEKVLGYFGVSSITTKRILVKDVQGLSFGDNVFCTAIYYEQYKFITNSKRAKWPIYIAPSPVGGAEAGIWWAPGYCFDCRLKGGVLEKPEFWE